MNKKVTLSIDKEVYDSFRQFCNKNAIMLSRKIEIWMDEFMKGKKENKKKGVVDNSVAGI
jgi:hypothetical protein